MGWGEYIVGILVLLVGMVVGTWLVQRCPFLMQEAM